MELGFETLLITGDEEQTCVLSLNRTARGSFIARFLRDAEHPDAVSSRIVAHFHDLEVHDPIKHNLPDRITMRYLVHQEISRLFPTIQYEDGIFSQGATVDIGGSENGWKLCYNRNIYAQFLSTLKSCRDVHDEFSRSARTSTLPQVVFYNQVVPLKSMGGRGQAMSVKFIDPEDDLWSNGSAAYFLKGLTFIQYLDGENFSHERDAFYHELELVCTMPRHDNILGPPLAFVLLGPRDSGTRRKSRVLDMEQFYVGGALYNLSPHGSLEAIIKQALKSGTRIGLLEKAKWCYNLSAALLHLHRVAKTYHMDIKTSNVLVEDDLLGVGRKAVFIDFEQAGAAPWYIAPEADGSYDVIEISDGTQSRLVYTKYIGPPRVNNWCAPEWNVFPIWREDCPKALEAAEVYSLGKTMWCLLQQVSGDEMADSARDLAPGEKIREMWWDETADDLPPTWKAIVEMCLKDDPNERISLDILVEFWKAMR